MKQDGQQETDFFNIVAWRQLGELCQKYLIKGRKCAVTGRLQTRSYEAKDGSKRTAWDIVAEEVEFLSPVGQSTGHQGNAGGYAEAVSKTPDAPKEGFTQVEDEELPF
ncbi:MAG: single-stranded DNA-binding protein, partial [Clostridiales bacterium]|nr:single-stranded DNA-binding protein [Clostridiales bacterium]